MLLPSQAALAQSATGYGARQDPLTLPETLGGAEAGDRVLPADAAEQLSARATCETLRLHFHFKETRLAKRAWEKTGLAPSCSHSPATLCAGERWLSSASGWETPQELSGPRDSHRTEGIREEGGATVLAH